MAEQSGLSMASVGTAPSSGEELTGTTVPCSGASGELPMPPEHFFSRDFTLEDVVAMELEKLEDPLNLTAIEETIEECATFSKSINSSLSESVMQNYTEFVEGMQQVRSVGTDMTQIDLDIKKQRKRLQEGNATLVQGSRQITKQRCKSEHLATLLSTMEEFQDLARKEAEFQQCLNGENYPEAIRQHTALQEELASDRFKQFPCLDVLHEGPDLHLAVVGQKLSDCPISPTTLRHMGLSEGLAAVPSGIPATPSESSIDLR